MFTLARFNLNILIFKQKKKGTAFLVVTTSVIDIYFVKRKVSEKYALNTDIFHKV